jgi:fused-like protein
MQTSVSAVNQFVASRGLDLIGSRQLLRRSESPALIGEVLGSVSSVARTNSEFYVVIHERVSPYSDFDALLRSRDAGLKAKVCSAVGNMARHNAFFYPHLKRLVSALTDACRDSDVNCKKFASFAIGNIAFHSAELYSELKLAIGVLVFLLKDEDEKTRSNAAGALGNLVRNSGVLVPAMIKEGVIEALLALARQTPIDSSGRISLFSLGNLAMHVASKEVLAQCGCGSIVNQLLAASKSSRDAQTVKYCERLLSKLQ